MQAKIDVLMREALTLDEQVDELLRGGSNIEAQRLQGQLNTKQQHLTIAESELHNHRLMTRHLMQEMATLDAALDQRVRGGSATAGASGRTRIPLAGASAPGGSDSSLLNTVSAKLDETRENLEGFLNRPKAPDRGPPRRPTQRFEIVDEEPDPRQPKPRGSDADEMNRRLSRLRKSGDDEG